MKASQSFTRPFAVLAFALAGHLAAPAPAAAACATWQATWMSSPQPLWDEHFVLPLGMPRILRDVTLRQALRVSLGGDRVAIVVSNEYGRQPLTIGRASIRPTPEAPPMPLRFKGMAGAVLAPGARMVSDPVPVTTRAGDRLAVDLYLPHATQPGAFHWDARDFAQLLPGDATRARTAEGGERVQTRAFVTEVRVPNESGRAAVVALGDSITDGNGSTPGADQRWPDHLARRLAGSGVAVLNAGISGNRLLRAGMGESGLARFDRDVLRHRPRAVIVLLGTNDIGWPGGPFAPGERPMSFEPLVDGFRQLAARARAQAVRVVGATLPPFRDALKGTPLEGHYSPEKERLRQAINAWIRGSGTFDAVVDFDAALRDPSDPERLRPEFDSGDHLHPGDAGYRAMADAVDLEALLGRTSAEVGR